METSRFETFIDAIIAIIMTVLVLKIPQPSEPTLLGIWSLKTMYIAYFISFLVLFNIWYNNHNLFQLIDTIDNKVVWINGVMTFIISLLPYFTIWLANNMYSIPAETMFGIIFIATNITYNLGVWAVYKSNPYNKELQESSYNSRQVLIPFAVLIIGVILTYTVFIPGIYVACMISVILWIIIARINRSGGCGN